MINGAKRPTHQDINFGQDIKYHREEKLYGLFPSNKKAKDSIQAISDEHKLCYQICGLEKAANRAYRKM